MNQQLSIEKLSHDGRGIARISGKTAFVSHALASEIVDAKLIKKHKRFDEYETLSIIKTSPDRITPSCQHYEQCGGCQLQHLSPTAQREYKQTSVIEQIERASGLKPQRILPNIHGSDLGYRSRARLSAWYHNRDKHYRIGFRATHSKQILAIEHCPILHEELNQVLPLLPQLANDLKLGKRLGHIDLQLHELNADKLQTAISLRVLCELSEVQQQVLKKFAEQHHCLIAADMGESKTRFLAYPHSMQYHLPQQNLTLNFDWSHFTQANRLLNRAMVIQAIERLELTKDDQVLDAFCGLGNFSLGIAQQAKHVIGVEGSVVMVSAAKHNAAKNQINNIDFIDRNLFDADNLKRLSKQRFNKALIDPPRDGAQALCEMLCKHKVERLVYVSCNPANLARDAKILTAGKYQLESIQINDMFPHSHHSEVTACFTYHSKTKK